MLHTHLFRDLALFVEIAERKSFSRAAVALGIPISSLSRRLKFLEETLGQKLIERTTRRLELTCDGENLLPQVTRLLADAERTISGARRERSKNTVLTIALPNESWAIATILMTLLSTRNDNGPRIRCSVQSRPEATPDADIVLISGRVRRNRSDRISIGRIRTVLVASPDYLVDHGTPDHPAALSDQRMVVSGDYETEVWTFARGCERVSQAVSGSFTADNTSMGIHLIRAGLGIGLVDQLAIDEDLQSGRLVRILPDWGTPSRDAAILLNEKMRKVPRHSSATRFISALANVLAHSQYSGTEPHFARGRTADSNNSA